MREIVVPRALETFRHARRPPSSEQELQPAYRVIQVVICETRRGEPMCTCGAYALIWERAPS